MRPDDPGFARALDAWITRCPADEPCAPCACCRIESTDLDAHGLCPSCVEPDEDDRAELLAGSPEADRADHEGPRPVVFDCAAALAGMVAA